MTAVSYISFVSFYFLFMHIVFFFGSQFFAAKTKTALNNPDFSNGERADQPAEVLKLLKYLYILKRANL